MSKRRIALTIRIITIPPIMISILLLILANTGLSVYRNMFDLIWSIFLLGFVPALAYGLQKLIPKYQNGGREEQRKIAFVMNFLGYGIAFIWAIASRAEKPLMLICSTYFCSVLVLTFLNKIIGVKASGHACSFTGPLILLAFLLDWKVIFPCLFLAAIIVWSSLYLRRHTARELIAGVVVSILSFVLSLFWVFF